MKFYPLKKKNKNDSQSIIKDGNHYVYSADGKKVGTIIVNKDTYENVRTGNYSEEFIKLFSDLDFNSLYFDTNHLPYDQFEDGDLRVSVYQNHNIMDLPYGTFNLGYNNSVGYYFSPFASELDPGLIIPNKPLVQMVDDFFNSKIETGRKNKKGFLLYGAPGNGKTTDIMSLFQLAEKEKIRIFIVSRKVNLSEIDNFKQLLEKDRTIFILEEITQRTDNEGTEELLTFLDGENSWNNCVVIATTNYAEDLPANLVDRPGRFDTFIEYVGPNRDQVVELAAKFGFTEDDVRCLMNEQLSYDYVSFILSQAKVMGKSPKETIQIERDKKARISKTFKGKMGLGF